MVNTLRSNHIKGVKYGVWTVVFYIFVFLVWRALLPSSFFDLFFGEGIWYIMYRLMPFLTALIFLVTGYSALKGDRSQVIPAIIHGIVLAFLITIEFT